MIRTEHFTVGERDFIRTWSDENRYVVREDIEYSEACDPAEFGRIYTEGDIMDIPEDEYATAGRILMGVEE